MFRTRDDRAATERHACRMAASSQSPRRILVNGPTALAECRPSPDVTWNGKAVRTAIWKFPLNERRMVRKLNIDGDAQADLAGHGGEQRAVFVYQIDSYHYW